MSPATKTYAFTLFVQGADVLNDESIDALFEAGCAATIAECSGRSRESIRLLATEQRGPGGFPPPVAYVDQKTRLWHWPDVARWLTEHDKAKVDIDPEAADLVAALNAAYDLREHTRRLPKAALALISEALSASRLARP